MNYQQVLEEPTTSSSTDSLHPKPRENIPWPVFTPRRVLPVPQRRENIPWPEFTPRRVLPVPQPRDNIPWPVFTPRRVLPVPQKSPILEEPEQVLEGKPGTLSKLFNRIKQLSPGLKKLVSKKKQSESSGSGDQAKAGTSGTNRASTPNKSNLVVQIQTPEFRRTSLEERGYQGSPLSETERERSVSHGALNIQVVYPDSDRANSDATIGSVKVELTLPMQTSYEVGTLRVDRTSSETQTLPRRNKSNPQRRRRY